MAFTSKEIRDAYLQDVAKYCPRRKVRGVWQNTVRRMGNLSEDMVKHVELTKKNP